jgi:hypothetical protein
VAGSKHAPLAKKKRTLRRRARSAGFDRKTLAVAVHCSGRYGRSLVFGGFIIAIWIFEMQHLPPVSSGARQPEKRPRPIPTAVKTAIKLMVHGGDDGKPLGLIDAARAVQLQPATLRRYFDRPNVISLLRAERKAFLAILTARNPYVLGAIRDDREGNQMARVKAAVELESMNDEDPRRRGAQDTTPFMTIKIIAPPAASALPDPVTIDVEPEPQYDPNDAMQELPEPRFKWPR